MRQKAFPVFAIMVALCTNLIADSLSDETSIQTDLVDLVMPGTVFIEAYGPNGEKIASGSGFFINDEGHVVTCCHVIDDDIDNCNLIKNFCYAEITTSDMKKYGARAIRYDPDDDLALLDVDIPLSLVHPLSISASTPKVGEDVFAVGAPENLVFSVTKGIISSNDRKLSRLSKVNEAYQIDATISPGSSGGPVLNMDGEVIGIIEATSGPGLNFAIPADRIQNLLSDPSENPPHIEWEKTFQDITYAEDTDRSIFFPRSALQTDDGNYIISANLEKENSSVLAKLDPNGYTLWTSIIEDCRIFSYLETDDGYILAGISIPIDSNNIKGVLIKTDSEGNVVWKKIAEEKGMNMFYSVGKTTDNGYIFAGGARKNDDDWDSWLMKTDSNGEEIWSKTTGGPEMDVLISAQETADGGFVLLGIGPRDETDELIKTDSNGDEIWNKTFHDSNTYRPSILSVQEISDGGFVLAGISDCNSAWLTRTDSDGCILWSRTFWLDPNYDSSIFTSAMETRDHGYILTGFSNSDNRAWLLKTDSIGNEIWNKRLDGKFISFAQETIDGGYILIGAKESDSQRLIDRGPVLWLEKLEE